MARGEIGSGMRRTQIIASSPSQPFHDPGLYRIEVSFGGCVCDIHFVGQKRLAARRFDHALGVGEGDRVGDSTSGSDGASGPSRLSCEDRKRQTGRDPEGPRSTLGPAALKVDRLILIPFEGVGRSKSQFDSRRPSGGSTTNSPEAAGHAGFPRKRREPLLIPEIEQRAFQMNCHEVARGSLSFFRGTATRSERVSGGLPDRGRRGAL
jgi:hypothetical protein